MSFDGKQQLPVPARNQSLAIDVAAMSTEGGCLLYGVGEDDNQRLTIEAPFQLAGARERIDQIVRSSIVEPPVIEIYEYPLHADPASGYLLIVVPASARAPHQVTVGGDLRFYGRSATGNRILTEGDIARLYLRRMSFEQDRDALLDKALQTNRARFGTEGGSVTAFARPVLVGGGEIWRVALETAGGRNQLQHRLLRAAAEPQTATEYTPHFGGGFAEWQQLGADENRLSTLRAHDDPVGANSAVEASIQIDGSARLFSARATYLDTAPGRHPTQVANVTMEFVIAGNLAAFFAMMHRLYELGRYRGHVDIGVAVDGLQGAASIVIQDRLMNRTSYDAPEFRRTARTSVGELCEPKTIAGQLLAPLFELTTDTIGFDAFALRLP